MVTGLVLEWAACLHEDIDTVSGPMEYKGYIGQVEFDDEANIFHGEVINLRAVVAFQGGKPYKSYEGHSAILWMIT